MGFKPNGSNVVAGHWVPNPMDRGWGCRTLGFKPNGSNGVAGHWFPNPMNRGGGGVRPLEFKPNDFKGWRGQWVSNAMGSMVYGHWGSNPSMVCVVWQFCVKEESSPAAVFPRYQPCISCTTNTRLLSGTYNCS